MTKWPRGKLTGLLVFGVSVVTSVGTSEPESAHTISITNGILGNFTINAQGDTNLTPITIYKQSGKNLNPVKTIVPASNLIG